MEQSEMQIFLQAELGWTKPNYEALQAAAKLACKAAPSSLARYDARINLTWRRQLRAGLPAEIYGFDGGLALSPRLGVLARLMARIVAALSALFAAVLSPLIGLRKRLASWYTDLVRRLGPLGVIISIPVQLVAFLGDIGRYLLLLLRQALNPLSLVWLIITLPAVLLRLLISRLIGALLMPWIMAMLDRMAKQGAAAFKSLMNKFPWMRRVLVGYLRSGKPTDPAFIAGSEVSQVLQCARRGLLGTRHYVMVVEGLPLEPGVVPALRAWAFSRFVPFYWERCVHVFSGPAAEIDELAKSLAVHLGKEVQNWP